MKGRSDEQPFRVWIPSKTQPELGSKIKTDPTEFKRILQDLGEGYSSINQSEIEAKTCK